MFVKVIRKLSAAFVVAFVLALSPTSFALAGQVNSTTPKCISYAVTTTHQGVYAAQYVTTKKQCAYPIYYYMCFGNGRPDCSYTTGLWNTLALGAGQTAQYSMDPVLPAYVYIQECPKGYNWTSPTGYVTAQYCYD
jgi:hypothetical protein